MTLRLTWNCEQNLHDNDRKLYAQCKELSMSSKRTLIFQILVSLCVSFGCGGGQSHLDLPDERGDNAQKTHKRSIRR